MAKNNNLGDLLTSIANAIRTKKGTQSQINAQNFDTEILSIQTATITIFFTGSKVLSTDTVIVTKDNDTYNGVWNNNYEGESGFIVSGITSLGSYNYTYTQGNNTQTGTILVDTYGLFNIEITFPLYLYNEGDECETITGGWTTYKTGDTGSTGSSSVTKYNSYIDIQSTYNSTGWFKNIQIQTVNKINTTGYTKIKFETTIYGKTGYGANIFGVSNTLNTTTRYPEYNINNNINGDTLKTENALTYTNAQSTSKVVLTIDISTLPSIYVSSNATAGGSGSNYGGYTNVGTMRQYIHKIWLE